MKIKVIGKVNLPDGEYSGIAGGYEVEIRGHGKAGLEIGVRGLNIKCTVTVKDGEAIVTIN